MFAERIKLYRKALTENQNKAYTIFILFFSCLFLAFLSSKLWLPSDVKVQNSAIGSSRNVTGSLTLILDSWQYNRAENYMEVSFAIRGEDDAQDYKFIPVAHTNKSRTMPLNVTVAYCSNDLLTIQFQNVPESWQVISLWIKGQDAALGEPDTSSTAVSDDLSGANFFCDSREVTVNNSLKPQSAMNYSLQSIFNQMKDVRSDIVVQNKNITAANAQIDQLTFDISSLKANQRYQTKDDIQKSNSAIQSKSSQISDLKITISNDQTQIKNDQDKLKKLNQKMDDTKKGKLAPILNPDSKLSGSPSSPSSSPASKNPENKVSVD
jgi:hypothetical protein